MKQYGNYENYRDIYIYIERYSKIQELLKSTGTNIETHRQILKTIEQHKNIGNLEQYI